MSVRDDQSYVCIQGFDQHPSGDYDRGKALVTVTKEPNGNLTSIAYDPLGRMTSMVEPNVLLAIGMTSTPLITVEYVDLPNAHVQRTHSTARDTSGDGVHETWSYSDASGMPLLSFEEADKVKDGTRWILKGLANRDALGQITKVIAPKAYGDGDPKVLPSSSTLAALTDDLGTVSYDNFGRPVSTYRSKGGEESRTVYHALSVESYDGNDLRPTAQMGAHPVTITRDGHGRIVSHVKSLEGGATLTTKTTYRPSGEPIVVEQVPSSGPSYTRKMVYDTLGRLVENLEPNTTHTVTFTPPSFPTRPAGGRGRLPGDPDEPDLPPALPGQPSTPIVTNFDWRYAYDDSGRLVGTSDARGCGENVYYDSLGRLVGEDYSPCREEHNEYSSVELDANSGKPTGKGLETFYHYDTPDAAYTAATGLAAGSLLGRLVSVSDLASQTIYTYSSQGSVVGIAKRLAKASSAALPPSERYTNTWMKRAFQYDLAYRLTRATTGADVPDLQNATHESYVGRTYTDCGAVDSVTSAYGDLLKGRQLDVEGRLTGMVLGDAAATTLTMLYKPDRQLDQIIWKRPPAPSRQGADLLAPRTLMHDVFSWDWAGNVTQIDDRRFPQEWPPGMQPGTRKVFTHDAQSRVTSIETTRPASDRPLPARNFSTDGYPSAMAEGTDTQRGTKQGFSYDALGSLASSTDDRNVFFDRSFTGLSSTSVAKKPHQLEAVGDKLLVTYDWAGNIETLDVARPAQCNHPAGMCSLHFDYEWDEVGQLMRAKRWDLPAASSRLPASALIGKPTVVVSYVYGADGQRVFKIMQDGDGRDSPLYTADIFPTLRLRRTHWNDGQKDYEHTRATEVVNLDGIGEVVYLEPPADRSSPARGQRVFLTIGDHLGSASAILDMGTGELVEALAHSAYGAADSDYRSPRWASFREDCRFTGKEEDTEVGLVYFGARYYAPQLGRWMSPDPLAVHQLGADLNPYAYVGGRIGTHVDPFGLDGEAAGPLPDGGSFDYVGKHNGNDYYQIREPQGPPAPPPDPSRPADTFGPHDFPVDLNEVRHGFQDRLIQEGIKGAEIAHYLVPIATGSPAIAPIVGLAAPGLRKAVRGMPSVGSSRAAYGSYNIGEGSAEAALLIPAVIGAVGAVRAVAARGAAAIAAEVGPGAWEYVLEYMPGRAALFQSQVAGRAPGVAYVVDEVAFDGFKNGVLLEAKGPGYANLLDPANAHWSQCAAGLLKQARAQLGAARGVPVQWHFAESAAANEAQSLFNAAGLPIRVVTGAF